MTENLTKLPEYKRTIDALEASKRVTEGGVEFWYARDIYPILGYETLRFFIPVIDRAARSLEALGHNPLHHMVETHRVMEHGKGSKQEAKDYFLSRAACRLIAMNGDTTKPEVAGAQAYFVVQADRMEQIERDTKRVELRDKTTKAFKHVSDVAHKAGLPGKNQWQFHNARYDGLYGGGTAKSVKLKKGLKPTDNLFDHIGPLELSANEFQMNMAADVIQKENIQGIVPLIAKNRAIAQDVRKTMKANGVTMPEDLPIEEPIKNVKRRLKGQTKKIA